MAKPASSRAPRIADSKFVFGAREPDQFPPPVGVEIAFAGRSNVGKSSLLNALLGRRKLARTSSTPGCTRQVSFFEVHATDGSVLSMVDLPGYGYAKRSKTERTQWATLVESYLLGRPNLAALVLLVDVRRGLEADEFELIKLMQNPAEVSRPPVRLQLVATKTDRLALSRRQPALARLRRQTDLPVLGFSVKDPATHSKLWQEIRAAVLS